MSNVASEIAPPKRFSRTCMAVAQRILWTPEVIAELTRINQLGWSSGEMAAHLGVPGRRNMIIGKLQRLGLKTNPNGKPPWEWTPLREAALIGYHSKGWGRVQIAKAMGIGEKEVGKGVTRLIKRGCLKPQTAKAPPRPVSVPRQPWKPYVDKDAETAEGKTFADLGRHDCRFTIGKGKFCAEPVLEGKSWCGCHFDIVYRQRAA